MLVGGKEIEKLLDISRTTLYRLRKKGLPIKKVGGQIRYDTVEVMKWIDENQ